MDERISNMKHILILTELFYLKAGTQALENTVRAYSSNFKITLISPQYSDETIGKDVSINNVEIIRIPTVKTLMSKLFIKKQRSNTLKHPSYKRRIPFNQQYDYVKYEYKPIKRIIQYLNISITLLLAALLKVKWTDVDLIVGYERRGAKIAKIFSMIFNKSLIIKYQGTFELYNALFKPEYSKRGIEIEKFFVCTKADYILTTDDGTNTKKLLKRLGCKSTTVLEQMNGYNPVEGKKINMLSVIEKKAIKKEFGISEDCFLFMNVNRLEFWKRTDRILFALKELLDKDNKLIIVGDGAELNNLTEQARAYSISDYVSFIGPVDHRELYRFYSIADICIQFADYSNLTNHMMEAYSLNIPIITLNDRTTDKFMKHGVDCYKVDLNNLVGETKYYVNLIKYNNERNRLTREIKQVGLKLNTWNERMDNEIEIIEELIDEK